MSVDHLQGRTLVWFESLFSFTVQLQKIAKKKRRKKNEGNKEQKEGRYNAYKQVSKG